MQCCEYGCVSEYIGLTHSKAIHIIIILILNSADRYKVVNYHQIQMLKELS